MKRLLITLSVIAASLEAFCAQVAGPDGKLVLTTNVQDGRAVYSVVYDGKAMLLDSPLGFESNIGNYCDGLTLVSDTVSEFKADFKQDRIKHYHVKWDANRLVEEFSNKNGAKFSIEWLVGNNDIAFRYIISKVKDTGSMNINKANITSFQISGVQPSMVSSQSALVSVPISILPLTSRVTHDFTKSISPWSTSSLFNRQLSDLAIRVRPWSNTTK